MHVKIGYGTNSILVDIPDGWVGNRVLRIPRVEPVTDLSGWFEAGLTECPPAVDLDKALATTGSQACIAVDPSSGLPALLPVLQGFLHWIETRHAFTPDRIQILLAGLQGDWAYPAGFEDLFAQQLPGIRTRQCGPDTPASEFVHLGELDTDLPLSIHRAWTESDARVLISPVSPSPLWGYSGGAPALVSGLAGPDTRTAFLNHPERLNHPAARPGEVDSNPYQALALKALGKASPHLAIHLTLNRENQVAGIFCGDCAQSHAEAIADHHTRLEPSLNEPVDILLTGGGGDPYDRTLAGTIRSMMSATRLLKPDGTLVILGACEDGLGPEPFVEALRETLQSDDWLEKVGRGELKSDSLWLAHQFHQVLSGREVLFFSEHLPEDDLWEIGLTPAPSAMDAISLAMESHGQECRIAVIPEGWPTLVRLQQQQA